MAYVISLQEQKTAFRPYSFFANVKELGCQLLSNYSVITVITVFWVSDFGYCLFLRRVTIKIGESNQKVRRK